MKTWMSQVGTGAAKVYELDYDPVDQLTSATLKTTDPTPVMLKRYGYAYDLAGNRTAEQVDDAASSWTANSRNQLASRQPGGALLFRGALNETAMVSVGGRPARVTPDNRFEGPAQVVSGTNTVAVAATDASGNTRTNSYQVAISGMATTYSYDANGSLVGDGTRTFEYDAETRLTRVLSGGSEVARFTYDGWGRRVQKVAGGVTRAYVYDGLRIVEERLSNGTTRRYVDGPGMDRHWAVEDGGVVSYFLTDHLDSVVQTTNAAGQVTLSREYDPYGSPLSGSSSPSYAFTGREWDPETGLYYYRARYYDPQLGRFLSEDPIGLAGGVNLYSYVYNNPVNWNDPTGEDGGASAATLTLIGTCAGTGPPGWVVFVVGGLAVLGIGVAVYISRNKDADDEEIRERKFKEDCERKEAQKKNAKDELKKSPNNEDAEATEESLRKTQEAERKGGRQKIQSRGKAQQREEQSRPKSSKEE